LTIHSHPFTKANVQRLYDEAKALIEEEEAILATGTYYTMTMCGIVLVLILAHEISSLGCRG